MANRKIVFVLLLALFSFGLKAQVRPVLYGGVDYFRDTGFESNAYVNFNFGAQVFKWKFFAPELGYEHYYGFVNERNQLNPNDPNARPPLKLKTRFSTNVFTMAPKLIFGNDEAALIIIPQYNFGNINGRGDLLKDSGRQYLLEEQQKISESISYLSLAAGVEGQIFDSEILYFSLFLKYNFLDSEEVLSKLELSPFNSYGGSSEGLGIGFRVYFDFIRLL